MTRRPGEGAVLALACAGSFVVILDATIVSVALPAVRFGLGFSSGALTWVVNAYTLAFAGFLLLGGRLCDEFGVRRMFVLGMSLFTVARLAAGLAGSPETLLAARTVQGFGGALLMPVTLSLLTTTFTEPARRARVLGTWSAVGAAGAAAGPVIGGLLTQWAGWRWVFFVSVPIGVAAVLAAGAVLPLRDRSRPRGRLDVLGAMLSTAGLVAVVYAVMRFSADDWVLPLVGGLVLLGVFLVHQHRWADEPLVALGIFRLRSVLSGNVVIFLLGLGFLASPILLSLYLQDVHGYSPLQAGLAYLPVGVAMFAGAQTAGGMSMRLGPRRAAALYCAIGAAGFTGVAALTGAHSSYVVSVLLPGMVFGFGTAAAFTPITVAATSGVPERQNGLAAGLLNTVRQTSGAIGLAALTALAAAVTATWQTGLSKGEALVHGYTAAFLASAACLAAAAVVAAATMPGVSSRRADRPGRGTRDSPQGSPHDGR
ncbi:DHA2 family efflux MFS transporter permease subunit [Amycolatopsis umgeniensis]|uniref:EmrB/QacA subfamily drug resistance transporter n=1 Tax=Amycolatopsis umgeniensis TaxID=336628 RepID=A0A841B6I0_9PSEU|nr:DHA2 family efflux MFS transporter permease subunit [Amycolatopsis umgeniensis]MBB5854118.1 EmrB/QacA subfamily drug resistance transporter [Amycolatopsis umgeniensis]